MIQEKDFLYRVPVKTAPITTPGGQIRNPEILVDVEGGEFMHGNILDANSTNKLINQSVKDAVDNKLIESGYVTKDLLDAETTRATEQENSLKTLIGAETSARTKGDEDLSSKIKAEQNRAEGKEKEISDKLAIVNGDSNTEGSFRKAIADVVAAAPEDLDTLKEIADKLAGNDDLHTALNQAITEKADASALLNEVTRATGAESGLQAAIATKADATALSNYVLTTALNKQVDTLNAAISAKQDAGNYIPYETFDTYSYYFPYGKYLDFKKNKESNRYIMQIRPEFVNAYNNAAGSIYFGEENGDFGVLINYNSKRASLLNRDGLTVYHYIDNERYTGAKLSKNGIRLLNGDNNHVLTSNASTIDITEYAKKTELPTVPTKTSQLTNDSNFITANHISDSYLGFEKDLKIYSEDTGNITTISHTGINFETDINNVAIDENGFFVSRDSDDAQLCSFTPSGIKFAGKTDDDIPTANGTFKPISDFVLKEDAEEEYATQDQIDDIKVGLAKKQDKIKVNSVDVTNLTHANIDQLINIVQELLIALDSSGLIIMEDGLE